MKKTIILAVALTLVLSGMALAAVVSTKHDMRLRAGATYTGSQVCVFCHHPHRGAQTGGNVNDDLLWNMCYNELAAGYPTYSPTDTTTDAVTGDPTVKPQSILCMSCHDSANGAASYYQSAADGTMGSASPKVTAGLYDIGTTFTDDHPIGFTYPTALAANVGDLATTVTDVDGTDYIISAAGGGAEGSYPLFGATGAGSMECSTCHNVHDAGPSPDLIQFMRGEVDNSSICIDCHTTK